MLLAFFLLVLPLGRAHGAAPALNSADEFAGQLEAYSDALVRLPPPALECRASYSRAYANDPLRLGVFFGYIDTARKNYVADGDFKQALIRRLTKGCRAAEHACGFKAVAGDPATPNETRLAKSQGGRAVELGVFDSSVSSDYAASVTRLSAEQEAKSSLVEREYLDALKRDAAVLYVGHSRRFSGTGFYPPLAFSRMSLATLLRRPFFARVCDTLKSSASPPPIVGLFSCHSREYYAGRIHALAPGTSLIVSSDISGHDKNLLSLLGALDLILARPCYGQAVARVNPDERTPIFHLYGLFEQSPHRRYTRYLDGLSVLAALVLIPFVVLRVAGWTRPAPGAWPAGASGGAWRGAAVLLLSLVPCFFVARAFSDRTTIPFPLMLSLVGFLSLAVAVGRGRASLGDLAGAAKRALPFLLAFLVFYLCADLLREPSVDNALSALRQGLTFALVFCLILPFVFMSEDALLAPFLEEGAAGFIPSCLHALVFYLALWLALCALAPLYKPKLWPVAALVLSTRASSFLLYRRKPVFMIPAIAQALTLALLITEGIHGLIYN